MTEPKWELTLSTTEKNNIGLIKPRKNNENSEVMKVKLIKNSKPYDLTALKVFFVTHFSGRNNLKVPVQKEATVINAEEGIFEFTLDEDCMQKVGRQEAYFEIYDYDKFLDATQSFTYEIISSSRQMKADFTPYITTWEEAEKMLDEGTAKVLNDKTEKLELQKANVVDVNEQLRKQRQETDNKLEKKTDNETFVAITADMQRQIKNTQSGMVGEYNSESELRAAYPNGAKGYAVVWHTESGTKVGYSYTY
ncbi:MAG: BppU family phage baseplate upper protein, partial [Vagococcus fluvialis]